MSGYDWVWLAYGGSGAMIGAYMLIIWRRSVRLQQGTNREEG